jgi:hypothetical protein
MFFLSTLNLSFHLVSFSPSGSVEILWYPFSKKNPLVINKGSWAASPASGNKPDNQDGPTRPLNPSRPASPAFLYARPTPRPCSNSQFSAAVASPTASPSPFPAPRSSRFKRRRAWVGPARAPHLTGIPRILLRHSLTDSCDQIEIDTGSPFCTHG